MKYLSGFVLLCGLIFSIQSCSNDFELSEDASDLAIVYGFINPTDSAQYIRVERAFIDKNTSAYVLAKDANQLYFSDILVQLQVGENGTLHELKRVDGNLEGYPRSSGVFADAPNYLYKIKTSALGLTPNTKQKVTLSVKKVDGTTLTSATTTTLLPLTTKDVDPPMSGSLLSLPYTSIFKVVWYPLDNLPISDVKLILEVSEKSGSITAKKYLNWKIGSNITDSNGVGSGLSYTASTLGRSFYEFMRSNLEVDPTITRSLTGVTLEILSGDEDIRKYIQIGLANQGITSSGEIPTYTNLSNGALGIFSTVTKYSNSNYAFAKPTLDSLARGIYTKDLNFK
ncbi:MAG: DUF4249 family protein [Lewinellaceae bacterium]|nr:DUF4249 family protein [Lewinellaceae bacterium]